MNRKVLVTIFASMLVAIYLAGMAGAQAQRGANDDSLMDLNSAPLEKLMTLTEVDLMTARKIAAGRPYTNKNQLVQKKIMTQEAFDKISRSVTVRPPAKADNKGGTKK
jgi:DNA uptake protein ComE-like DNA-binding protein